MARGGKRRFLRDSDRFDFVVPGKEHNAKQDIHCEELSPFFVVARREDFVFQLCSSCFAR